jgi:hypothetical protein
MKYPSGNSFEGEWNNDMKNGYGIMIWRDLDEVFTGNWKNDKPHGYGEHIWGDSSAKTIKKQNCNIYRGSYSEGSRKGFGTFFYMNGSQYSGNWKHDMKDGPGIFIYPDGKIVAGNYENNRLIQSINEDFKNIRVTEDINPQYHLNINSLFDFFPLLELNPFLSASASVSASSERAANQKKIISDVERLLLKYNSYLKQCYRYYNEMNNKQRIREVPFVPNLSSVFDAASSSGSASNDLEALVSSDEQTRYFKFLKPTISARNISKRFYCLSIEYMIRFLREISLLDQNMNCYDVIRIFQEMKEDQLTVSMKQYAELLTMVGGLNSPRSPSAVAAPYSPTYSPGSRPESTSPTARSPQLAINNDGNAVAGEEESTGSSVASLLADADLSIGRLLDDYQDIFGFDSSFYQQVNQPLLEHEFIELFVRVIGERQIRTNEILNLYQSVEKVLAQNVSLYACIAFISFFYSFCFLSSVTS